MKLANIILIISFVMTGCYSTGQIPSDNYEPDNYSSTNNYSSDVSYQTFYDELQPYGNWINYPGYGYVWQPNVRAGFRPYETDGHWVTTVDGWAWASDHRWGWAPFHYGRWLNDPSIGWAWVPGYEWAPAWVTWGRYNNYYAWAPLAPGINISFGNTWRAPYNYWSYAPNNCIGQRNLHRYIVRDNRNPIVVNNITIINNYNSYNKRNYYDRGPEYREVEQYTHRTIRPASISSTTRPGVTRIDNNKFEIYRPAMAANKTGANIARPSRIKDINEVRTSTETRRISAPTNMSGQNVRPDGRLTDNVNKEVVNSNDRISTSGNNEPNVNNFDDRNIPNNAIRPATGSNINQQDLRSSGDNLRTNPLTGNVNRPVNTVNQQRPIRVPDNNQEVNRQRVTRDQQAPAVNSQPVRTQPVLQNNQRVIRQNIPQQNTEVIRQPQRQLQQNRQPVSQGNVQVERPRTITPQQPANANRPSRRQ